MSHALTVAAALTAMALSATAASAGGFYPPFVAHFDPPPAAGGNAGSNSNSGMTAAPHAIKLACIVGGTPVEFPNDIWMTNTTKATLVKGTMLAFTIPSIGVKGNFLLPANVAAGQQLKIADLFGGAEAGAPCTVKLG